MKALMEIRDLRASFFLEQGEVKAVNGVSLRIDEARTLGIVGESGCGKSVTARSILQILGPKGRIVGGEIVLHDNEAEIDLARLQPDGQMIRDIRGKTIAMVFQEPMSSLSPVYTIGNQIIETIRLHRTKDKKAARQLAIEALADVGLSRPEQRIDEYPHQLSGGMLQRATIAMALACRPKLLVADEPTTAIDVTTQAQILDLLRKLQAHYGMSIMMITHNLGVIAEVSDTVAVMYLGMIMESGPVRSVFMHPLHPYTQALFRSVPHVSGKVPDRLSTIEGSVPDAFHVPLGCPFHPRCDRFVKARCEVRLPPLLESAPDHHVRCSVVNRDVADE